MSKDANEIEKITFTQTIEVKTVLEREDYEPEEWQEFVENAVKGDLTDFYACVTDCNYDELGGFDSDVKIDIA